METNNLKSYISTTKTQVDVILEEFYAKKVIDAGKLSSEYKKLITDTAKQTLRGGKRLRPALAILGYTIAGGTDHKKIRTAAASLEIFHNYLLIHDDIMDRDDTRHGGLNITGTYKKRLAKVLSPAEAEHIANAFAISAGDVNCGLTYELLLSAGFPAQETLSAVARLSEATFEVAAGQHLDIIASYKKSMSQKDIISISRHKTADYSIIMPLQFGAILAGGNTKVLDGMRQYGQALGIGYQLADDVIGIFGNQKTIGKPVLSDLQEGKQTMLMRYGMQLASQNEKKQLKSVVGNPKATMADLKMVRKVLEESGAKAKTLIMAQDYAVTAIDIIPLITNDPAIQKTLTSFAQYCVARSS